MGMTQPFDTDAFWKASCEAGFVKLSEVARNVAWTASTEWGPIEVTVNLSKPEKDPRDIAEAAARQAAGEPSYVDPATGALRACPLCVTQRDVQVGYARPLELGGEKWAMWYSPYAYYGEHCIAMSWEHRPMHVDAATFERLFDLVDLFPQYFFGSNADLPVVGGSILAHDHFQGGRHAFALQAAPVCERLEIPGFPDVESGFVRWPATVVRIEGASRARVAACACAVLDAWCVYDDPQAGIVSGAAGGRASDGSLRKVHSTVTPMLRKDGSRYVFDLALRCNVASALHPLGVFHPHEEYHHIKKENIGLIEVMGLAILPPRVLEVMELRGYTRDDVGRLFAEVLECSGVFKWDAPGAAARRRFARHLQCG